MPGEATPRLSAVEAEPFQVLVVCTANRCRSPLAEHLLRIALPPSGATRQQRFVVASAGVRALEGEPMEPLAVAELRRLGGDPRNFRSRQFRAADCAAADLVLTATVEHRVEVLRESPRALRRTFTLLELASLVTEVESVRLHSGRPSELVAAASLARGAATLDTYDIADPVGRSAEVHRTVADVIAAAAGAVAAGLAGR